MAIEAAVLAEVSEISAAVGMTQHGAAPGEALNSPLRLEFLMLAFLSAMYEEMLVQTAHLAQIETNTTP